MYVILGRGNRVLIDGDRQCRRPDWAANTTRPLGAFGARLVATLDQNRAKSP